MSRQKRAVEENYLWGNPCDYADSRTKSNVQNPKEDAEKLVKQAKIANTSASQYKDPFAKELYSYPSFDEFISQSDGEWLRKFQFPEEVLPKEKVLGRDMPEVYINTLMNKIDDVLPSMNKALKLIVAGLHSFSTKGLNTDVITSDENLKRNINETIQDVRAVLCYFNDIMTARKLEILPLPDSEIPEFNQGNMLNDGLFLYRDTLNYLEYLSQVFKKLYGVMD